MKISKSKQELARIISENGGWRDDAKYSSQDKDGDVNFFTEKPEIKSGWTVWSREFITHNSIYGQNVVKNWHQAVLSRDEFDQIVAEDIVTPENFAGKIDVERVERYLASQESEPAVKPTIEQLAAEYRNAKDYAELKQVEADTAKADADARLKALELAGEAIGLLVSPINEKQEPEMVITDWRDLQVGDEISVKHLKNVYSKSSVLVVGAREVAIRNHAGARKTVNLDETDWSFIRRP